jgi:hypothetical protein
MNEGVTAVLDHNSYYPDGEYAFRWGDGGSSGTFAEYQAATAQDANGTCQNPLFVDTAGRNFRLKSSSPCRAAGDPTTTPGYDLAGSWRPTGSPDTFDMGAYQYTAGGIPDSLDAGVLSIATPTGTIDSGVAVTPSATVHNYGTKTISPTVKLTVSTYKDSVTVTNLTAGSSSVVNFANWTPLTLGTFAVSCSTRLANDQNTANDKATGSVIVARVTPSSGNKIRPNGWKRKGAVTVPEGKVR